MPATFTNVFIGPPNSLPGSMFVNCLRVTSIVTQRVEVEVGIDGDGVRGLLGDRRRSTLCHRWWRKYQADKKT